MRECLKNNNIIIDNQQRSALTGERSETILKESRVETLETGEITFSFLDKIPLILNCIYKITNIVTNKNYVGSALNLNKRIRRHISYLKRNKHHSLKLQKSFLKHGIDNFLISIIEKDVEKDNLLELEKYFVNKYDSINNGYNMIRPTKIYNTRKQSVTAKLKAVKALSKSVICLDLFGNFIKEYDSISEASKELDLFTTDISQNCKNRKITRVGNYQFEYKTNYNKENKTIWKDNRKIVYIYDSNLNLIEEIVGIKHCSEIMGFKSTCKLYSIINKNILFENKYYKVIKI